MMNIDDERRAALSQYAVDLACGNADVCTFKLQKRYFTPSNSPQYHINFNFVFDFIFTRRRTQHPSTRADVSARVMVHLDLARGHDEMRRVCHEKTRVAILEALDEAYLPHFPTGSIDRRCDQRHSWYSSERDDLVTFASNEAWRGVVMDLPLSGYKDLNLDLLVTVKDPFVWIFDPSEGLLFNKNNFCYACAVDMYKEPSNSGNMEIISCTICLQDFSSVQGWRFPCKHVFHGDCIQHWLRTARDCPVCQCQLR